MIIIGEKVNGSIPSVAKAIAERDGEWIRHLAKIQSDAGADFIDVCASVKDNEVETLHWLIDLVQEVTDTPICIDSPNPASCVAAMIRLAIIGRNFVVDWMLAAAEQVPELKPVAIYSRGEQTGREFAARHGLSRVFTDLNALAESPDADAVYIASPICCHYEQALAMLRHGKHVLCEKPVTSNAREVRALVACAREHGVVFLEAMKLSYKRTILVGLAFLSICSFWQMYDSVVPLILTKTFHMLMSALFFRERLTGRKLLALGLTFAGCCFVSGLGTGGGLSLRGLLLGLGAGFGYALYSIFGRFALQRGYDSWTILFYTFLFCAAGCAFLCDWPAVGAAFAADASLPVWVLLMGFLTAFLAYLLYTHGLAGMLPTASRLIVKTAVLSPRRAQASPASIPACPAPITATSKLPASNSTAIISFLQYA